MSPAIALIRGFVAKCGGPEKCRELLDALKAIPDAERADYIRRAARTDVGARQIFASVVGHYAMCLEVVRRTDGEVG